MKKVPAAPQQFSAGNPRSVEAPVAADSIVVNEPLIEISKVKSGDALQSVPTETPVSPLPSPVVVDSVQVKSVHTGEVVPVLPIRRDYSLLIAGLMIFAGIVLIIFGILTIPYFNVLLVLRLVIGALYLLAAWRLIKTGTMIFISRFRNHKTYKEN